MLAFLGAGVYTNTDNLAFDTSLQAMSTWQHCLINSPHCHYFSIVGNIRIDESSHGSKRLQDHEKQAWIPRMLKKVYLSVNRPIPPQVAGINTSTWLDEGTDGLVTVFSQRYPRLHVSRRKDRLPTAQSLLHGQHVKDWADMANLSPGKWHHSERCITHLTTSFRCPLTWEYIWDVVSNMAAKGEVAVDPAQQEQYEELLIQQAKDFQKYKPDQQKPYIPDWCASCEPFAVPPLLPREKAVAVLCIIASSFLVYSTFSLADGEFASPHFDGVLAAAILSLTVMLLYSGEVAAHRGDVKNIDWPHTYCSIFNVILALWTYYRGVHAVTIWILGTCLLVGTLCQSVCSGSLIANRTSICNVILSAPSFATLLHSDTFRKSPIAWVVAVLNFLFVLSRTPIALMYFSPLFSSLHFLVLIAGVYMLGWGWMLYAIFTCPMIWLDVGSSTAVVLKLIAGAAFSGVLEQCYQALAISLQHAYLTRAYGNRIGNEM